MTTQTIQFQPITINPEYRFNPKSLGSQVNALVSGITSEAVNESYKAAKPLIDDAIANKDIQSLQDTIEMLPFNANEKVKLMTNIIADMAASDMELPQMLLQSMKFSQSQVQVMLMQAAIELNNRNMKEAARQLILNSDLPENVKAPYVKGI